MRITIIRSDRLTRDVYFDIQNRCQNTGIRIINLNIIDIHNNLENILKTDILLIRTMTCAFTLCQILNDRKFRGLIVFFESLTPIFKKNMDDYPDLYWISVEYIPDLVKASMVVQIPRIFKQSHLNNFVNFHRIFYREISVQIHKNIEEQR